MLGIDRRVVESAVSFRPIAHICEVCLQPIVERLGNVRISWGIDMHIHLPKPIHGWRGFVGEIGIIVIGVLLALGAEQAIEALHHRSQVHEATEKLRAESVENRSALNMDIFGLQRSQENVDKNLSVLGDCRSPDASKLLVPIEQYIFLVPTDRAWIGVRDSALLPLLPTTLSDNYFKIDTVKNLMLPVLDDVQGSLADAAARVEGMRRGLHDQESCQDAVIHLLRLKLAQENFLNQTSGYREFNEQAIRGEPIDAVIRPGSLNVLKNGPR